MEHTAPDRRTVEHTALTASERTQRAQLGASVRWSQQDGYTGTQKAREAFLARFEREVDPEGLLDPATRAKRAEHAKRAYFQRLALTRHRNRAS